MVKAKEDEIDEAFRPCGRNAYESFVEKPERKRPF
jgi:hypothetical protein